MSDAARLASLAFAGKPGGTPYGKFSISPQMAQSIGQQLPAAIMDTAYSAIISYAEAIFGINKGWSSWSVIRLYYSAFYCLKTMMLLRSVIPFNSGGEMLFDVSTGKFLKGGRSSHHWNWHSVRQTALKHDWFTSQDSEDAYIKLRTYRENVNYTHTFTDPNLHRCLVTDELDLGRKFRVYRDDTPFVYTYLNDHLAVAYPTKLIFELDSAISGLGYQFEPERLQHLRALWNIRDRCPLT
jgi:hypothetical protein